MLYLPLHELNAVLKLPKFYLDVREVLPRFKRMTGAVMDCQLRLWIVLSERSAPLESSAELA